MSYIYTPGYQSTGFFAKSASDMFGPAMQTFQALAALGPYDPDKHVPGRVPRATVNGRPIVMLPDDRRITDPEEVKAGRLQWQIMINRESQPIVLPTGITMPNPIGDAIRRGARPYRAVVDSATGKWWGYFLTPDRNYIEMRPWPKKGVHHVFIYLWRGIKWLLSKIRDGLCALIAKGDEEGAKRLIAVTQKVPYAGGVIATANQTLQEIKRLGICPGPAAPSSAPPPPAEAAGTGYGPLLLIGGAVAAILLLR